MGRVDLESLLENVSNLSAILFVVPNRRTNAAALSAPKPLIPWTKKCDCYSLLVHCNSPCIVWTLSRGIFVHDRESKNTNMGLQRRERRERRAKKTLESCGIQKIPHGRTYVTSPTVTTCGCVIELSE